MVKYESRSFLFFSSYGARVLRAFRFKLFFVSTTHTAAPEIPDDHRNNSFPFALGERESREHNAGKAAIFHSILAQSEEERKEGV